uniref:Uncharacterized protein n=1 Tax=Amphimedon queenslandica TaxID=400682 RepID=A0A1X7UF14_AMPQE
MTTKRIWYASRNDLRTQLILAHFDFDSSVAVVKRSSIISISDVQVGEVYEVKAGSKYYSAKILEIGDEDTLARAEEAFYAAEDEEEEPESTGSGITYGYLVSMMDIYRNGKTEKAKEEKTKEKEESGSIINVSHHITNRKSTIVDGPFKKKKRNSVVNAQSSKDKDYDMLHAFICMISKS